MGVTTYGDLKKISVENLIKALDKFNSIFFIVPLEHYSIDEIRELSKAAIEKDIIMSIRYERSNFYYGALIQFSRKSTHKENNKWIDEL